MTFLTKAALYRRMDDFRRECGVSGALEPLSLAEQLGIKVSVYSFDSARLSGALLRGERHCEIILSAARSAEGRRFTLAHELVHWYLHAGTSFWCSDAKPSALEWQANAGAAELLMPYREVLPAVKNIRSLYVSDRAAAARALAGGFGVSAAAAGSRLSELEGEISQYLSGVPLSEVRVASRAVQQAGNIDL